MTTDNLGIHYTHEELEGLDRLHEHEKKKGWIPLKSAEDVDQLIQ